VNQALFRRAVEARFVTLLYGVLQPDGHLTYCNAGHNPPFLVGPSGVRRLETGGLIVGLFGGAEFEQETLQLKPDDMLVVFTDGASEALSKDGEEYGDDRILEAIRANQDASTQAMLEAVFESVREFTVGAEQNDDITAMVVRYLGDG
jgi:sigma-B regulation protein RsbU (phosphoserine phosphatase)